MRPAGSCDEVSLALLSSARALVRRGDDGLEHGPTMEELAQHSGVAKAVTRQRVSNLKRAGHLRVVAERMVSRRNRPAAEYAPVVKQEASEHKDEVLTLDRVMAMFVNR